MMWDENRVKNLTTLTAALIPIYGDLASIEDYAVNMAELLLRKIECSSSNIERELWDRSTGDRKGEK